jgi:hypothetical protein
VYTFRVRLAPHFGVAGGVLTTEIRASSGMQARLLAQSQYPNYDVIDVQQV